MKNVTLIRSVSIADGTFGHLVHADFHVHTCEPESPREGNKGRIPVGIYLVKWIVYPTHTRYTLQNVPNFTAVQIHAGNDEIDTHGCILPGLRRGLDVRDKEAVLDSVRALALFEVEMDHEDFTLSIIESFDVVPLHT